MKRRNSGRAESAQKMDVVISKGALPRSMGNVTVFPARLKKTFVTSGTTTLTADGLGSIQRQTLSINSLFDPDYSGTGLVPRYYQTLLGGPSSYAPYGRYCVVSARVRVQFVNQNSTSAGLADVGVYLRTANNNPLNTSAEMYESEYAKATTLGAGYADNGVISMQVSVSQRLLSQMQNCKDLEDSYVNFGSYNTDPSQEVLLDLLYVPYSTSSTLPIYLRWSIEQDAVLFALNEVDQTQLVKNKDAAAQPAHVAGCLCDGCKVKPYHVNVQTPPALSGRFPKTG